MKKAVIGFFKMFINTLKPDSYSEFSESTQKNTWTYYSSLIFNALLLMFLIMIFTVIFNAPSAIQDQFDKIDTFTINVDFKTNAPIMFPEENPVVLINSNNATPDQKANIALNKNILYYGVGFKRYFIDFSQFKDAKTKKTEISNSAVLLLVLLLPTILLVSYFYLFIKTLIIILAAMILARIVLAFTKYSVNFRKLFNIAAYGISLTVLLDVILFAFSVKSYNLEYVPFVILLIIGIAKNAELVSTRKRMRGYVDLR